MTEDTQSGGGSDGRRLKLIRLIDEYDLDDLGAELEQQWTADPDERSSLRELADYVNRELLEAALRDANVEPLSSEIETLYSVWLQRGMTRSERGFGAVSSATTWPSRNSNAIS